MDGGEWSLVPFPCPMHIVLYTLEPTSHPYEEDTSSCIGGRGKGVGHKSISCRALSELHMKYRQT